MPSNLRAAQDAAINDPPWVKEAYKDLGLHETPGSRATVRIIHMFAEAGHRWVKDDETAWCAAAVGAWLKQAGLKGTGKLTARSYLSWGKPVSTKKIPRGAIVVFRRGNSSWQGHVAIALRDLGSHVEVIGGNQSHPSGGAVTIVRYSKAALLGARWPSASPAAIVGAGAATAVSGPALDGAVASMGTPDNTTGEVLSHVQEMFAALATFTQWAAIGLALIGVGISGYGIWRLIRNQNSYAVGAITEGPNIDEDNEHV